MCALDSGVQHSNIKKNNNLIRKIKNEREKSKKNLSIKVQQMTYG